MLMDVRALHEFAQTKIRLAQEARNQRAVNRRLLADAQQLLERVVHMDAPTTRHAWAWRDLARVRNWLRMPETDVESAFDNAIQLLPSESRFHEELAQYRARRRERNSREHSRRKQ